MQRKITKGRPWRPGELGRADDTCMEHRPIKTSPGAQEFPAWDRVRSSGALIVVSSLPPTFWVTLGESVPPRQRCCGKAEHQNPPFLLCFLLFFEHSEQVFNPPCLHTLCEHVGRPGMLTVCAGDHQAFPGLPVAAIA